VTRVVRAGILTAAGVVLVGCGEPPVCGDASSGQWAADCASWSIFAQMNRRAAEGSRDSQWERWAEATDVFNGQPPRWPDRPPGSKVLRPLRQLEDSHDVRLVSPLGGKFSEVRLNRATFDFIQGNGYWNVDGLKTIAEKGVNFPKESIEVKAVWAEDKDGAGARGDYHWQYDADGNQPIKLTGLHMSSKIVPNWLWATWKHESTNADPSDDVFGYPGGKRSADLERLFAYYRVPDEWKHYRLIGSQTNFVRSTGEAVRLGNSKIELGSARRSSCITCHAIARVDATGTIYKEPMCDCEGCNLLGAPVPVYFAGMKQLDFVWSFREITGGVVVTPTCKITRRIVRASSARLQAARVTQTRE
jgi:hypothetical protein